MFDDLSRIALCPVNKARLPAPQHGQTERVHPWTPHDTAIVLEMSLLIRHVQPTVVWPKAGRPHDRADFAASQIDLQPRRFRHARGFEAFGFAEMYAVRPRVESVEQTVGPRVESVGRDD